jgi:hypothetical protein
MHLASVRIWSSLIQASFMQLLAKQGLDVILAALQNVGGEPIASRWTSAEPKRQRYFD